jgi:hypothetical protein
MHAYECLYSAVQSVHVLYPAGRQCCLLFVRDKVVLFVLAMGPHYSMLGKLENKLIQCAHLFFFEDHFDSLLT